MKIYMDGTMYEGTGMEIMESLRQQSFDPTEYPDTESYIWQLRENFIRTTGLDCILPESDVERQAQTMIAHLAKAGSLEVLEDG